MNQTSGLKRHIGVVGLTLFGVGDILGAGIYGLIGKGAGEMGQALWLAFAVSALAALLTGLSYATLGSRFPVAAGASYVMEKTFGRAWLAFFVGLGICFSGITSMATAARVLAGYLAPWLPSLPPVLLGLAMVALIALVVFWGIRESLWLNAVCTTIELAGLLLILVVGLKSIGAVDYLDASTVQNPTGDLSFGLILSGAVLTFYSFLGFEDILNVSEEVKEPQHTLPRGLLAAVVISSTIYVLVSLVAVAVIPPSELAQSGQPLVDVVARLAPWFPVGLYRFIAMFAVTNTLLLNYIMGSRLIYGMAHQRLVPKFLGQIHGRRQTPHWAILVVFVIVVLLVSLGDVSQLARATSTLLLMSFLLMNLALIFLQRRSGEARGAFEVHRWVPFAGAAVCLLMLLHTRGTEWQVVGALMAAIALLFILQRKNIRLQKQPE